MKKSVALGYNKDIDMAPKILSKGKGFQAERINAIALHEGIPVIKHSILADSLLNLHLGQFIPEPFYIAVADIISFVYTVRGENEQV